MSNVSGRSFLIVTPCDDGPKFCFWESLRAFEKDYHAGLLDTEHRFEVLTIPGDSLVPRARNNLAYTFLEQTAHDYLFSIDSDLDFRAEDIMRMCDVIVARDLDIVCGSYAIKQDEFRWCINTLPDITKPDDDGLQQIAAAPGGLNVTHRRVFEEMIRRAKSWPHWLVEYTEDHTKRAQWDFYFNGVVLDRDEWPDKPRGRYLSEDWGFSYFARNLGFKIWWDTKTVFLHRGECFYPKQARRLTKAEMDAKAIAQPDGSKSDFAKAETV